MVSLFRDDSPIFNYGDYFYDHPVIHFVRRYGICRVIQLLVDFVLALIFLLVCAVVVWPLVSHWLKTAEIPDSPVFVNEDGTPYEYDASTEWVDVASHIEFPDPFDPENCPDIVSGVESDAPTRSGDYDASLTE